MNITDSRFRYIPASTHTTSEAFRERQQKRMREAQRKDTPYQQFCRHPEKCAGKSNCQHDPNCID